MSRLKKVENQNKDIEIQTVEGEAKKRKKVAIVGSASTTLGLTPFNDYSFEIWGLAWRHMPRVDRVFDIHPSNFDTTTPQNVQKNYAERLANFDKIPIYLTKKHPDIPNSIEYPLEEILKFMGPELDPHSDGQYFASSIAFLICLAMYEKFEEIHLYGIDFVADGEYGFQRPNMEYLIGVARGKGIEVFVPPGCALIDFGHIYGYQPFPDVGIINRALLIDRLKQYREKHQKALDVARTTDGAIQECEQLLSMVAHHQRGGKVVIPPLKETPDDTERKMKKAKEASHG